MRVLILVGATAGAGLLTVLPLALLDDPRHAAAGTLAAALCLIPAVGTLLLAGAVGPGDPDTTTTVILVGIGLRFVGVTAGVFLLDGAVTAAGIGRERFAGWAVFFYLMTLTAESVLLLHPGPTPPADSP
ncbi:hypothetical protein [Urbifossiella limnaea]|uniref:Uncharacterized protein n=1 Tax=Urbifossiella limnaea TaxID=2528023 RepID=A0A517Y2K0_9BACT|nr:hypothetical protein [Urbifossiella limnaea]QDU23997.1 hypothetical protein ETAA1_60080 [Urbifossiella limnaea]